MKNAQRKPRQRVARRILMTAVSSAAMLDHFAQRAVAASFTASWIGGATGNYSQPINWSTGQAPNDGVNAFFNVIINRPGGAAVDGNLTAEILNLTIGAS